MRRLCFLISAALVCLYLAGVHEAKPATPEASPSIIVLAQANPPIFVAS